MKLGAGDSAANRIGEIPVQLMRLGLRVLPAPVAARRRPPS
jgi:hypothetical protein